MAYTINKYNGTILANVADGTLDTSTSISLAGRNFAGYGEFLNENQLWQLEHFAGNVAPADSITGQLWYDTGANVISVFTGSTYKALVTAEMLTDSDSAINTAILSNIALVNANIISNVATLTSNAASQTGEIANLWANAVTQSDSVAALWANAATQDTHLNSIDSALSTLVDEIDLRANIASPTFTGVPLTTTPTIGDRSTKIASTNYVMTQDDLRRGYIDTSISANISLITDYMDTGLAAKAPVANAALTGTPVAPTPSIGDRSTALATTQYVMSQDDIRRVYVDTNIAANILTLSSAVNNNLALKAPVADPTFTGTVAAPTPTAGDSSTKVATTAFVQTTVSTTGLWQGSHRYISTSTPDNGTGTDGDFWFQYL